MEKGRGFKVLAVVALCVAVLGISVAFAAMQQVLNIRGTATMEPAVWLVKFDGLELESSAPGLFVTDPQISDTTIETFAVKLTKPGDTVRIKFTVKNEGDSDAQLTTLDKREPICAVSGVTDNANAQLVCANIDYTLLYANNSEVKERDDSGIIASRGSADMVLTLTYNASATEIPTESVDITNLGITLTYTQIVAE